MIVLGKRSWFRLLTITQGAPIRRIWLRLLCVVLVASVVTYLHEKHGYFEPGLTTTPFTTIALALGIFLGFRNNTSYDRFWEGRRLWGAVVNTTRTLCRQIHTLVDVQESEDEEQRAVRKELSYRVIGYTHSLRHHLRVEDMPGDSRAFLPDDEGEALAGESNPPIAILFRLGERFRDEYKAGRIHAIHMATLEESLRSLTDIQGACERIKSTPIPASYTLLIHRLVACYVFALPFGLVSTTLVFTPLVVGLVAYAFLGLDAIGDEIEEPFGEEANDLPLSTLSRMIEVNIRQRLGDELPPLLTPDKRGMLR